MKISTLGMFLCGGLLATAMNQSLSGSSVIVTIENMSPYSGTFQTPVWVGFHDGNFDLYDAGAVASTLPSAGSMAIERIAEDGNTGPLMDEFSNLVPDGVQSTLLSNGPIPPFAPGQSISRLFKIDPTIHRYFSYASMVIPSNDAFIANGSPMNHPVFDENGNFVAESFFVSGAEVNDAGTEVNDELPANTAFFGQSAPNTGVDESGVVGFHPGFNMGPGGILDDPMFHNADFLQDNFNMVRISFAHFDRNRPLLFTTDLSPMLETPPPSISGNPGGEALLFLTRGGRELLYFAFIDGLSGNATAAHLHLAPVAQAGPVVVPLQVFGGQFLFGRIRVNNVTGPLANTANPFDALLAEIIGGNVYINVHTAANPSGEVRGQVHVDRSFPN